MPRRPIPIDPKDFITRLELALARLALRRIRPFVESKTLRDALAINQHDDRVFVGVPHYWAQYYHDGRAPARPGAETGQGSGSEFLVWFPNPKDDPRHRGKFPVRATDIQRLTREQFAEALAENKRREDAAEGGAFTPFVVVALLSPRSGRNVRGTFFFERGLTGFALEAGPFIKKEFQRFVNSYVITDKATAQLRINI